MTDGVPSLTAEEQRRYIEALDTLPLLTRAVLMIARFDDLSSPDIAWRCGISEAEVQVRLSDALLHVRRYVDGRRRLIGYVRRELLPWRCLGRLQGPGSRQAVGSLALAGTATGQA